MLHGEHRGRRTIGEIELGQNVGNVALDGVLAKVEHRGNLSIGHAAGHNDENLALARTELHHGRRAPRWCPSSGHATPAKDEKPRDIGFANGNTITRVGKVHA